MPLKNFLSSLIINASQTFMDNKIIVRQENISILIFNEFPFKLRDIFITQHYGIFTKYIL